MSARQDIMNLMHEMGIEPKKSLGQNFLISETVISKILRAVERLQPAAIVEIGPGLGSLTRGLLLLQKPIQVLELDWKFIRYWQSQNLTVIEGDALHWHWNLDSMTKPVVLVSNLPYQISKSIVVDRCLDPQPVAAMVLMFQKEVAQKLKAPQGSEHYGMMSALAQTFWDIDIVADASSGDFLPPPKVASRVLEFRSKPSPVASKDAFFKLLKACFLHPRKLMISNLIEAMGRQRTELQGIFGQIGISEKVRAEELTPKQFLELYRGLGYQ